GLVVLDETMASLDERDATAAASRGEQHLERRELARLVEGDGAPRDELPGAREAFPDRGELGLACLRLLRGAARDALGLRERDADGACRGVRGLDRIEQAVLFALEGRQAPGARLDRGSQALELGADLLLRGGCRGEPGAQPERQPARRHTRPARSTATAEPSSPSPAPAATNATAPHGPKKDGCA